jgi:hypothetical protein
MSLNLPKPSEDGEAPPPQLSPLPDNQAQLDANEKLYVPKPTTELETAQW